RKQASSTDPQDAGDTSESRPKKKQARKKQTTASSESATFPGASGLPPLAPAPMASGGQPCPMEVTQIVRRPESTSSPMVPQLLRRNVVFSPAIGILQGAPVASKRKASEISEPRSNDPAQVRKRQRLVEVDVADPVIHAAEATFRANLSKRLDVAVTTLTRLGSPRARDLAHIQKALGADPRRVDRHTLVLRVSEFGWGFLTKTTKTAEDHVVIDAVAGVVKAFHSVTEWT
ncbi:hypothetical protein HDU96_008097, partial [Phlyctochytrium bullatum]